MIETTRFHLVELTKKNATPRYLSWLQGTAGTYLTNIQSDKESLVTYIESYLHNESAYLMGIFTHDFEEHIGNVKFEYLNEQKSIVEIGILIGEPKYRGRGVAGEVIKGIADYLRSNYATKLIVLGVSKNNKQAIAAYTKLGFKPEYRPLSEVNSKDGMLMSWRLGGE